MSKRAAAGSGSIIPWKRDGIQVGWVGVADLGVGPDGRRKRKALYGKTQREVRDRLNEVLRDRQRGVLPTSGRLTVGDWLERWLASVTSAGRVRPRTLEHYRWLVEDHLTPALGSRPLAKLSPSDVEVALGHLRGKGLSARTVSHARAVLRNALNRAIRDGLVSRNVAALADGPEVPRVEMRALTPDEARAFLATVHGDRLEALYVTTLGLGLRQGEVLGLRWPEVDLEAGILRVSHQLQRIARQPVLSATKSDTSRRTLLLPEPVAVALAAHRRAQAAEQLAARVWLNEWGLVFVGEHGEPLEGTAVLRRFQAHLRTAGLPVIRFHDYADLRIMPTLSCIPIRIRTV